MDLNNISSNLLLIGFALVSLCCLYLLYSNFTKVREIEELKRKVEDLKKIFFNQQQHNDETYARMITMIQSGLQHPHTQEQLEALMHNTTQLKQSPEMNNSVNQVGIDENNILANEMMAEIGNTTQKVKVITIDPNANSNVLDNVDDVIINKEGADDSIATDKKEIILDLHDLDNVEPTNNDNIDNLDNLDDLNDLNELETESLDNILDDNNDDEYDQSLNNLNTSKPNIFDINNIDDTIDATIDDIASITTDPIVDLDDVIGNNSNNNFNIDEIDNLEDIHNLEDIDNLDDLDDIDNLDSLDNIKKIDITVDTTTTDLQSNEINTKQEDLDLNELLNGKSDKKAKSNKTDKFDNNEQIDNDNIKKIEITDDSKTNLHNMSIKQLKDLAKSYKLKTTGTKSELIAAISKVMVSS